MNWLMVGIWAAIFIVTLIIELQTADLTTIWFCLAALITLVCTFFKVSIGWQVGIFTSSTLILLIATRPLTKKMMDKEIIHTNSDRYIGMLGIVTKEILPNEIGEVKLNSETWRAITFDNEVIDLNEKVIVNSLSGNKLVVSKVEKSDDIEII